MNVARAIVRIRGLMGEGKVADWEKLEAEYNALTPSEMKCLWPMCLQVLASTPVRMPTNCPLTQQEWNKVCMKQTKFLFESLSATVDTRQEPAENNVTVDIRRDPVGDDGRPWEEVGLKLERIEEGFEKLAEAIIQIVNSEPEKLVAENQRLKVTLDKQLKSLVLKDQSLERLGEEIRKTDEFVKQVTTELAKRESELRDVTSDRNSLRQELMVMSRVPHADHTLTETIHKLSKELRTEKEKVAGLETQRTSLEARIETMQTELESHRKQKEEQDDMIGELGRKWAGMESTFKDTIGKAEEGRQERDRRIEEQRREIEALSQKVEGADLEKAHQEELRQCKEELERTNGELSKLREMCTALEQERDEKSREAEAFKRRLADGEEERIRLRTMRIEVSAEADNLRRNLETTTEQINALRSQNSKLASELEQSQGELETAKGDTITLNDELRALKDKAPATEINEELIGRVTELEKRLAGKIPPVDPKDHALQDWILLLPDMRDESIDSGLGQRAQMTNMLHYFARRARIAPEQSEIRKVFQKSQAEGKVYDYSEFYRQFGSVYFVNPQVFESLLNQKNSDSKYKPLIVLPKLYNHIMKIKLCPASLFVILFEEWVHARVEYFTSRHNRFQVFQTDDKKRSTHPPVNLCEFWHFYTESDRFQLLHDPIFDLDKYDTPEMQEAFTDRSNRKPPMNQKQITMFTCPISTSSGPEEPLSP